jgi:hypothetical protein
VKIKHHGVAEAVNENAKRPVISSASEEWRRNRYLALLPTSARRHHEGIKLKIESARNRRPKSRMAEGGNVIIGVTQ